MCIALENWYTRWISVQGDRGPANPRAKREGAERSAARSINSRGRARPARSAPQSLRATPPVSAALSTRTVTDRRAGRREGSRWGGFCADEPGRTCGTSAWFHGGAGVSIQEPEGRARTRGWIFSSRVRSVAVRCIPRSDAAAALLLPPPRAQPWPRHGGTSIATSPGLPCGDATSPVVSCQAKRPGGDVLGGWGVHWIVRGRQRVKKR
ncbi:hypothetical protein C8R46DRAFT_1186347 [Mycena filopes]|nr:hypothetical protein C8R46DRAFT_1186347 [Mycena filopes]